MSAAQPGGGQSGSAVNNEVQVQRRAQHSEEHNDGGSEDSSSEGRGCRGTSAIESRPAGSSAAGPTPQSTRPKGGGSKASGWGSLRPPSASDLKRRGRSGRAGNEPEPFTHLVVLDFEWTADNRFPVRPISEITQVCVFVTTGGKGCALAQNDMGISFDAAA
mmetsp:Transcript_26364/g.77966  ORF Transcript_26364/g.77966 Transcript_26364/m.77966 type:complete len:162 (-) Transcript_26364:1112-1597(-)